MFVTKDYKINELGIQLYKNGLPDRSIDFIEIQTAEFKYGPQTKYPVQTLLFGLILIGLPNLYAYHLTPISFPFPSDYPKWQLTGIIVYLFVVLMGLAAFYLVLSRTKILKIKLTDGSSETLYLKKLEAKDQIPKLITFLKERVTPNCTNLVISSKLLAHQP